MKVASQQIFIDYIHRSCGITLGPEKGYLLEQRLVPLLREMGMNDLDQFADFVISGQGNKSTVREKVIVAITTNETSFFRDGAPWNAFQNKLLPELCARVRERKNRVPQRRGPKVRIWSAACSTGQEPYTIAMSIQEYLRGHSNEGVSAEDFEIVATDISPRVLSQALQGHYSSQELARGIGPTMRDVYFETIGTNSFQVRSCLQRMVDFRTLNLMLDFSHLGSFDVILCRNVLIYFDEDSKRRILETMRKMLDPLGLLILGAAENIYGMNKGFESIHVSGAVYYKLCSLDK